MGRVSVKLLAAATVAFAVAEPTSAPACPEPASPHSRSSTVTVTAAAALASAFTAVTNFFSSRSAA